MHWDAGAQRIAISLVDGGISGLSVSDDGVGIAQDELALALERHATSKLPNERIEEVETLGFRGEALPSIASVATLSIESRQAGADGWSIRCDNGALEAAQPCATPPGTRACRWPVRPRAGAPEVPAQRA